MTGYVLPEFDGQYLQCKYFKHFLLVQSRMKKSSRSSSTGLQNRSLPWILAASRFLYPIHRIHFLNQFHANNLIKSIEPQISDSSNIYSVGQVLSNHTRRSNNYAIIMKSRENHVPLLFDAIPAKVESIQICLCHFVFNQAVTTCGLSFSKNCPQRAYVFATKVRVCCDF